MPGANKPVTKNGHVSPQSSPGKSLAATARTTQNAPARNVVTSDAASASIGGTNASRIVTASAPNDSAAPAARRTTKIGAAGFEPATSASQTQHSDQAELRPVHPEISVTPGMSRHSAAGYAMVALAATLFAINGTVSKVILGSGINSQQLTEIRCAGAFAGLLLIALATRPESLPMHRTELPLIV